MNPDEDRQAAIEESLWRLDEITRRREQQEQQEEERDHDETRL